MRFRVLWTRLASVLAALLVAATSASIAFADTHGGEGRRHDRFPIYELMTPLVDVSGALRTADAFGLKRLG